MSKKNGNKGKNSTTTSATTAAPDTTAPKSAATPAPAPAPVEEAVESTEAPIEDSGAKTESAKSPVPTEPEADGEGVENEGETTDADESDVDTVHAAPAKYDPIPVALICPEGNIRRVVTTEEHAERNDHIASIVDSLLSNFGKNYEGTGLENPVGAYIDPTTVGDKRYEYQLRAGYTRTQAFGYILGMDAEEAAAAAKKYGLPTDFQKRYEKIPANVRADKPSETDRIRAMLTENQDDTRRKLKPMDIAYAVDRLAKKYSRKPLKGSNAERVVDYALISGFFPRHTKESLRQLHTLLLCDPRVQDAVNSGMPHTDAVRLHKTPSEKIADLLSTYRKIERGEAGDLTKKDWQKQVSDINAAANPGENRGRKTNAEKERAKNEAAAKAAAEKRLALPKGEKDGEGESDDDDEDDGEGAEGGDSTDGESTSEKPAKSADKPTGKKPGGPGPGENIIATMLSQWLTEAGIADEITVQATRTAEGKSAMVLAFSTESALTIAESLADYIGASPEIKTMIEKLGDGKPAAAK